MVSKKVSVGIVVVLFVLVIGGIIMFSGNTQKSIFGPSNSVRQSIPSSVCNDIISCNNYLKSQGLTDSQISSLDVQCNSNGCTTAAMSKNGGS